MLLMAEVLQKGRDVPAAHAILKDAVALYISPGKHGGLHRKKYFDMGKPCPVVMSFGHHPLLFIAGCTDVPVKMSEFAYAGGVLNEPIQLVRGPHTGLPIPSVRSFPRSNGMVRKGGSNPAAGQ